jgi:post-segregation antitoxin (ccd killing protein)
MGEQAHEKPTTQPLGAYVPVGTVERLREIARQEDRSVSAIVRRALAAELERHDTRSPV